MAKYSDPYSELVLYIQPIQVHTHSSEHTHTVNTHPGIGSHIAAAPGEQSGFGALLKGLTSVVVLKVEESAGYSLQNQNVLDNWDRLSFGGIKKRVNFYHCRVVVSTTC